jgi:hypothetical protein
MIEKSISKLTENCNLKFRYKLTKKPIAYKSEIEVLNILLPRRESGWLGLFGLTAEVRNPVGAIFLISTISRPALGPSQPPIQWV